MSINDCENKFDQTDPRKVSSSSVIWDGEDIPCLGICKGANLTNLELAIINKVCAVDESIDLSTVTLCQSFIDALGNKDKTVANLFQILFDYNCTIPQLLNGVDNKITSLTKLTLNLACLSDRAPSIITINSVFQLIIDTICELKSDYEDFKYSMIDTINTIVNEKITEYINSISVTPYDTMPKGTTIIYNGNLVGKFDSTGKGIPGTQFEKWAICNGANNTKDRRGFVSVMATKNLGNNPLDQIISPSGTVLPVEFNTSIGDKGGSYSITLTTQNLPSHTHGIGITINDPGHSHTFDKANYEASEQGTTTKNLGSLSTKTTSKEYTGITATGTISPTGSGEAFDIRTPFIADVYIEKIF